MELVGDISFSTGRSDCQFKLYHYLFSTDCNSGLLTCSSEHTWQGISTFKLYLRSGSFSFIPQETVSPTVLEYKSLPVGHIIQFYESQSLYSNAEEGLSFKQSVSFLFKPVSKTVGF